MKRDWPRVVVATTEFAPFRGGLATYAEVLARGLASRGIDVEVIAPAYPEAAVMPDLSITRIPLAASRTWLGRRWLMARALFHATIPGPATVVVATTYLYAQAAVLLELLFPNRFRLIVTVCGPELIGFGAWSPRDWFRRWVLRMIGRRAQGVICISRYTLGLARAAGLPEHKCPVVYVGVDANAFRRVDGGTWRRGVLQGGPGPVLLTVGRLERRKGHDTAIRAVADLRRDYPGLRYVIIGVGPEEPRLRALSTSLGIEEHVVWYGRAAPDHLRQAYSACDVFFFPTRQEGQNIEAQGLVIIEAGLCEAPVAVGAHGGAVEIVTHEKTGLLFEPSDPVAAAAAVRRLLMDAEWARGLGRAASREWRMQFSIDAMVEHTLEVFSDD